LVYRHTDLSQDNPDAGVGWTANYQRQVFIMMMIVIVESDVSSNVAIVLDYVTCMIVDIGYYYL